MGKEESIYLQLRRKQTLKLKVRFMAIELMYSILNGTKNKQNEKTAFKYGEVKTTLKGINLIT